MEVQLRNIKFTRGDSYSQQIEIETGINDIKEIKFVATDTINETKIEKKLNDGIDFVDNVITLQLKPTDTDKLKENKQYTYGIKIYYGVDDELTIVKGLIETSWKALD